MVRLIWVFILCVVASGCQSVAVESTIPVDPVMQRRFISLSQLRTGLSRDEVMGLLGQEIVTGYSLTDKTSGEYKPLTTVNPYRSEVIEQNKRTYQVDYYLVGIKVADGKVSDDELVPLVYYHDRLAGIGWDFFNQQIKGKE